MHCWLRHSVYSWVVDCNRNGVDDAEDVTSGASEDCNVNLNPDECELDCDASGVPDVCEIANGTVLDANGNGNPDECDDFDGDGILDDDDDDIDGDGVANGTDPCDYTTQGAPITPFGAPLADTDNDCDIDLTDFKRFQQNCLPSGPGGVGSGFCQTRFDADLDQNIDLNDYAYLARVFTGSF
jgi:hypothetical protein